MIAQPMRALCLVALLVCCLMGATSAQVEVTPADVRLALEALKEAPADERTQKRQALVELGELAIDPLVEAVGGYQTGADANYVGQCMIALGELKAESATDTLIDVLDSNDLQLVYLGSAALGSIWRGKGSQEEAKKVNAALFGVFYSDVPPLTLFGPGLALAKINGMPIQRPDSKTPAALYDEISAWLEAHPDALPPADQRPWQLNLYTARRTQDAAERQAALEAFGQTRSLQAVEPILAVLADEESAPDAVRQELGAVLGDLTGVPFPLAEGDADVTVAEQVYDWRWWGWLDKLRQQTDERYVSYAWRQLEKALRDYAGSPDEESAALVQYYRAALLSQLPDRSALPGSASDKARELLAGPLDIKKRIAEALNQLEGGIPDFDKQTQLRNVAEETEKKFGQEIGALFLGRLAALARDEVNLNIAKQYGAVLSGISGIPCDLGYSALEKRQENLDEWQQEVLERGGVPLELPAE